MRREGAMVVRFRAALIYGYSGIVQLLLANGAKAGNPPDAARDS